METKGSGCRVSDLEEHSIPLLTTLGHLLCSVLQWGLTSHSNAEKAKQAEISVFFVLYRGGTPLIRLVKNPTWKALGRISDTG